MFRQPSLGETALVTGALLAAQHKLQIPLVIAVAAGAAILGDNLGYLIGRKAGRWLLERPGPLARSRRRVLSTASRSSSATVRAPCSSDAG